MSASLTNHNLLIDPVTGTDPAPIYDEHLYWDASTNTATYAIQASTGILADGNYRAALSKFGIADASGDALASDSIIDFKVLAGDANNDGSVNAADYVTLSNNFGGSPRDFTQGDFNYDATVNAADYVILSNNFGATIPNPPTAPNQVTVGNATASSLQLTWQDVEPNATGYRIERSTDGETFSIYQSIVMNDPSLVRNTGSGITNISWNDTALPDGTRYWYRVRAYGNSLDTAYTPKTAATTVLPAPSDVYLLPKEDGSVIVEWTDNSGNETRFEIVATAANRRLTFETPSNGSLIDSYTIPLLDPSNNWSISIKAVGVNGESAVQMATPTKLLSPDRLNVYESAPDSVTLLWHDRSITEDGFRIEQSNDNGVTWFSSNIASANSNSVPNQINWNVPTLFRVVAFEGDSLHPTLESDPSAISSVTYSVPEVQTPSIAGSTGFDPYYRTISGVGADITVSASTERGAQYLAYDWTIAGSDPSTNDEPTLAISSNDTSPTNRVTFHEAGLYTVVAYVINGDVEGFSTVHLNVTPVLTSLAIELVEGGVYVAHEYDQFGHELAPDDMSPVTFTTTGDGQLANYSDYSVYYISHDDEPYGEIAATAVNTLGQSVGAQYVSSSEPSTIIDLHASGDGNGLPTATYSSVISCPLVGNRSDAKFSTIVDYFDDNYQPFTGLGVMVGGNESVSITGDANAVYINLPADSLITTSTFVPHTLIHPDYYIIQGNNAFEWQYTGNGWRTLPVNGYGTLDFDQEGIPRDGLDAADFLNRGWAEGSLGKVKLVLIGSMDDHTLFKVTNRPLKAYLETDVNEDGVIGSHEVEDSDTQWYLPINNNDDNADDIPDWEQQSGNGDAELRKVTLNVPNEITFGTITLTMTKGANGFKVWSNNTRSDTPLLSATEGRTSITWNVGDQPSSLWIEGIPADAADFQITVSTSNPIWAVPYGDGGQNPAPPPRRPTTAAIAGKFGASPSAWQLMSLKLNEAISKFSGTAFYVPSGLSAMFTAMRSLLASSFLRVSYAAPGVLGKADAKYFPGGNHDLLVKPSLDYTTTLRELERALDDKNGWHSGNSDQAYLDASAVEWGMSYLLDAARYLKKIESMVPDSDAAASTNNVIQAWKLAWIGFNRCYTQEVPLDQGRVGRTLTPTDLWDVNSKLGLRFAESQLRPIYENLLRAHGFVLPTGLPLISGISAIDPLF